MMQVPDLNPAAATGVSLGVMPPKVGALTAELTRGTELVSFRIPLALKALVSRIVADPRSDFNGTHSHFYLQAAAYAVLLHESYFRGDKEFEAWAQSLRRLDSALRLEEPLEAFGNALFRAEKAAETALAARSLEYGLLLLREAVGFVLGAEGGLHAMTAEMLRDSKPMQALCRALVDDEVYGLSDEVAGLQKFMGRSL